MTSFEQEAALMSSTELRRLEDRFHQEMLNLYDRWRTECRYQDVRGVWRYYVAVRFRQGVENHGGLKFAKRLLHSSRGLSLGFLRLKQCGRLDLTVEACVLQAQWEGLFTLEERAVARRRLTEAGYEPAAGC